MAQTLTNALAPLETELPQDRPLRTFFILWTGQ